jgi:hypothetical protein
MKVCVSRSILGRYTIIQEIQDLEWKVYWGDNNIKLNQTYALLLSLLLLTEN